MTGVDVDLLNTGAATLTVTAGTVVTAADEAAKKATLDSVKDLVTTFNDTLAFVKQNMSYNAATKTSGLLLGDSLTSTLQSGLTRMFADIVDDSGVYRSASAAGIVLQRDGSLTLDEAKLKSSLETDATALKDLFLREDGLTFSDLNGNLVKVNSTGKAAGAAGDGIANRLSAYVDMLVSNSSLYNTTDASGMRSRGALLGKVDSLDRQISDMDKRIEDYTNRLEAKEQVLRQKFLAMEKVIAMLRGQGNYLSGQLGSLPSFGSGTSA
jgi:flagellar hook-associated protein 2